MPGLEAFAGYFPYASELFGVYQPLLGWKSLQNKRRASREASARAEVMIGEALRAYGATHQPLPSALADIDPAKLWAGKPPARRPRWLNNAVGNHVYDQRNAIARDKGREPTLAEWRNILSIRNLKPVVAMVAAREKVRRAKSSSVTETDDTVLIPRALMSEADAEMIGARRAAANRYLEVPKQVLQTTGGYGEALITAGAFLAMADTDPRLVALALNVEEPPWAISDVFVDPLANFDPETSTAILSPVGLVHLYRQYFFEFDTFLGTPVGHVWISPGGLVELVEVSTRRTLTERTVESVRETRTSSEIATIDQDELADSVKQDNQRNLELGASVSGGANTGVWHAEASVNFGMNSTNRQAEETTHRHMRQQSEKIVNEIRSNFRSTFRTTTEVTDTTSRRYVIQNTTDKLVNYELRRKMRRVGVQVQHIGTRLCWQVYIDDPGRELGIAELVHVAKPQDTELNIQPPEAPTILQAKETEAVVQVPYQRRGEGEDTNNVFIDGSDDQGNHIVWRWPFDALPPGPGYTLASVQEKSIERTNPKKKMPSVAARYEVTGDKQFTIHLLEVNFEQNPAIRFLLQLLWNPPDQAAAEAERKAKETQYAEKARRAEQIEYVKAVRERIELSGNVASRPFDNLRQEERTVVFRRLIEQLLGIEASLDPHVTVELVRSIFDIESMLYFVAPEWWQPRPRPDRSLQQFGLALEDEVAAPTPLTEESKVGWGGVGDPDRPNYLITEESKPARLGSSLGWLLQLDGDDLRNAFLNSPWVKAVVPVHPGRERAALNWLRQAEIEGADGLDDANYPNPEGDPAFANKTIGEALEVLAGQIAAANTDIDNTLATEVVYEKGFDPLPGFRVDADLFKPFDQWVEILPTDQVVAVEYLPAGG